MYTSAGIQEKGRKVLQIHDTDNVGVALVSLQRGEEVAVGRTDIRALDGIGFGHKIALCDIGKGEDIVKYGVSIGVATAGISTGCHVHTHNMRSRRLDQVTGRT
jgi:altronate hydrolase